MIQGPEGERGKGAWLSNRHTDTICNIRSPSWSTRSLWLQWWWLSISSPSWPWSPWLSNSWCGIRQMSKCITGKVWVTLCICFILLYLYFWCTLAAFCKFPKSLILNQVWPEFKTGSMQWPMPVLTVETTFWRERFLNHFFTNLDIRGIGYIIYKLYGWN